MLKQIGIAHGTVGELVRSVHARTLLSVERALWTWTVYARFHAEKWCEVWPAVDKRDNAALERAQRRALVAILGHAAPPRARIKGLVAVRRLAKERHDTGLRVWI